MMPWTMAQAITTFGLGGSRNDQTVADAIERHWELLPPHFKPFFLEWLKSPDILALVEFWSSPASAGFTRGRAAFTVCNTSWVMADEYLTLRRVPIARGLLLNGCVVQQACWVQTPIETIAKIYRSRSDLTKLPIQCDPRLKVMHQGTVAAESEHQMRLFLQRCQQPTGSFMDHSENNSAQHLLMGRQNRMKYVDEIGDDWNPTSRNSNKKKSPPSQARVVNMKIHLVDESSPGQDGQHSFDILSSTTLKTLFKDYAEKRGLSLRSLRFSYDGKILFLSSAGNKTAAELGMKDQDTINVHNTTASEAKEQPSTQSSDTGGNSVTSRKAKKSKCSRPKSPKKAKSRPKESPARREEPPTETLEECKALHSAILTKIHEELQPQLGKIRMRLNRLDLKCQSPKTKKKKKKKGKKKGTTCVNSQVLPDSDVGGKAGTSCYVINVGEVRNLYNTSKQHAQQSQAYDTIDLHGHTREEALDALNEKLPGWIDTAMKGQYPWVIPVKVVCGCGNQILSDAVKEWIKSTRGVSNAPKKSVL